jgi:hypothetical protein
MNETHASVETTPAGHGFTIKGKPGDRYVVSGNGFDSRGSWYMEPRLKEMQADGTWLDIGTVAEVEAREKTPG